jgi:hypothetical protein
MENRPSIDHIYAIKYVVDELRLAFPAKNSGEAKFFAIWYPVAKLWQIYCTDHKVYNSKEYLKKIAVLYANLLHSGVEIVCSSAFYNASHTKHEMRRMAEGKHPCPVIGRSFEPEQNYIENIVAYGNNRTEAKRKVNR